MGGRSNSLARWIEDSGGGWVVAENDVAGVRAAVAQARDPDERRKRGRAARAFAEQHFDCVRNVQSMVDLLEACGRTR